MGTWLSGYHRATKGGPPSRDIFPYWPPVWLSTQGDPSHHNSRPQGGCGLTRQEQWLSCCSSSHLGLTSPQECLWSTLSHLRPSARGLQVGKSWVGAKELAATRLPRLWPPLFQVNSAMGDSMGQVRRTRAVIQGTVTHTEGLTGKMEASSGHSYQEALWL